MIYDDYETDLASVCLYQQWGDYCVFMDYIVLINICH
jgi:hypothetical protein